MIVYKFFGATPSFFLILMKQSATGYDLVVCVKGTRPLE